ncbi:TerC family protein [Marinicrinis sediminis]|uniref:TerC family protein n=1 Tax=Marinicrinis sediminis TaxID=1652465 RepID=A0ABW5RC89_9BACL
MEALWIFVEIMLINIVLSGDNAVVIAMASQNLHPKDRKKAVWWGALGAVVLRIALTAVAVFILKIPFIEALGALLLLYIAIKLTGEGGEERELKASRHLLSAVWTIIVADFIMSLDNVLAVAAIADGHLGILIAGIALSIPMIIWGSTMMMSWMDRYPVLHLAGAAILAYTAGEMLVRDAAVQHWLKHVHTSYEWVIPVMAILLVLLSSRTAAFRRNKG